MKNKVTGFRCFLETAAWLMVLMLMLGMAGAALVMTAQLRMPEKIHYIFGDVAGNALPALGMLVAPDDAP